MTATARWDPGIAPTLLEHAMRDRDEAHALSVLATCPRAALRHEHLHRAIALDMPRLTGALLARGTLSPYYIDGHGSSLLSVAAVHGSAEALGAIVDLYPAHASWAPVLVPRPSTTTALQPLTTALLRGHRAVATQLLRLGADIHSQQLALCATLGTPAAVELAWQLATAAGGVRRERVDVALGQAAERGRDDAVRTLLALGADPDTPSLPVGSSALARAARRAEPSTFALLLEAGAHPRSLPAASMSEAATRALHGFRASVAARSALQRATRGEPQPA